MYAYVNGNGGVASGDGYRYSGRGIFQLSQKNNYIEFTNFVQNSLGFNVNYVQNPSLIKSDKQAAILSAMWFYKVNVLDKITVDKNTTVKEITRIVNGKRMNGLEGRKNNFQRIKNNMNINCNN